MYIAPSLKEMYENRAKINKKIASMTPAENTAYFNRHDDEMRKMGIIIVHSTKKA